MSFAMYHLYAMLVVVVLIRSSHTYYAFPRQGRAMSYFFSRMGRAGPEDGSNYCCPEGVRRVVTSGKGAFEICPRDQSCCNNMEERTKLYKDVIITECDSLTENSNMEKIHDYLAENR